MTNGGDAAEMLVRLYLEGFEEVDKLSGKGIKELVPLLASTLKQESKSKGKARLTQMIKSGSPLKVFTFKNKDLKKFTEQAKRYGVLYTVLRDKNSKDPNATVDVIARAEDASKIQRIADRFEFSKVDKASIVKEVEKSKEKDKKETQIEEPVKSKGEIIVEEAMAEPSEKKENAHENPDAAKADKSPQSRQNSGKQDTNTDKGTSKSDVKKPSVKEKLERYKAEHAAGQKKEAERNQPKHIQEKKKTPSKTRQTKHKQPKKKQKAKHYKLKER